MEIGEAFSLISHAIDCGRAAHGYLLCGDLRESCDVLAGMILHKLFPEETVQIDAHCHPDVVYLEPSGAKQIIPVKQMRETIILPMAATSFSGGWKVGVISGADRMEAPSANAFLKSLEEPTPKTLYLLLTDQPDCILPTIVSRTQRIELPLSAGILEGEDFEAVSEAFANKDVAALQDVLASLKDCDSVVDAQLARKAFFKTLIHLARKLMLSGKLPRHRAFANIEAIETAYRQIGKSMGEEAVLSFMLDRIAFP